MFKNGQCKQPRSFSTYVITRWLRFTPTIIGYICVVLLVAMAGTGPLFHTDIIRDQYASCIKYSWMQLLYITNWFEYDKSVRAISQYLNHPKTHTCFPFQCGFQVWFLSADMQLYLLAYVVLVLLHKQLMLKASLVCALFIALSYAITISLFIFGYEGVASSISIIYPQLE